MNRVGVVDRDPSFLKLGVGEEHRGPRFSSSEVLRMLGLRQRQVRQWLGEPEAAARTAERAQRRQRPQPAARYSLNDIEMLRSAKELGDEVPARTIRAALASLKRRLPAGNSPLALRLVGEGKRVIARDDSGAWEVESGQQLFDFASSHSLWPLDPAVPTGEAAGELSYRQPGEPAAAPPNVLRFEDRRRHEFDAHDWYEKARDLELSEESGAIEAYREALRLDPDMVDAHIDLGRLLHEQDDLEQARLHYRLALEVDEQSATASFNLGVVLEDLGEHEQAMERYTATLAIDPLYADAYYNLSRLYEVRGDRGAALRCLQSYRRASRR